MDTTAIVDRLVQIQECLHVLNTMRPMTYYEEFSGNYLTGTAERSSQIAIQAALDIGSIILADQQVG